MHAVHLYWRARHCRSFYIYAWAFALQSDDRALVIRLENLGHYARGEPFINVARLS